MGRDEEDRSKEDILNKLDQLFDDGSMPFY